MESQQQKAEGLSIWWRVSAANATLRGCQLDNRLMTNYKFLSLFFCLLLNLCLVLNSLYVIPSFFFHFSLFLFRVG